MNLLNRVMSYDKTKNENQENCNCAECLGNAEISEKREIAWDFKYADDFLTKIENYRLMCREYKILNTMNLEYWYKDVKTKNFIWKSLHVHGDKYIYHKSIYVKSKEKLLIECRVEGHEPFPQRVNDHLNGHGCKLCGIKIAHDKTRMTLKEFIEEANQVHGEGRYDYSEVKYVNYKTEVWIICHKHDEPYRFPQKPSDHLRGEGCFLCGVKIAHEKQKLTLEEFIEKANEVHGIGRYDYSKVKYVDSYSDVIIICHKHDEPYEFKQNANSHLQGSGCRLCAIEQCKLLLKMTKEEFVERAIEIHDDLYDYSKVIYEGYDIKVQIICKKHNRPFEMTPHSHLMGSGCPLCCSSKGETAVRNWLIENEIEFEEQKRFNDCRNIRPLPFDFYTPQYNLCIEFDGKQHFIPTDFKSNSTEEEKLKYFELVQMRDSIKTDYCKNNNINLLRIKYTENIEEKLTEYFQNHAIIKELNLFDL